MTSLPSGGRLAGGDTNWGPCTTSRRRRTTRNDNHVLSIIWLGKMSDRWWCPSPWWKKSRYAELDSGHWSQSFYAGGYLQSVPRPTDREVCVSSQIQILKESNDDFGKHFNYSMMIPKLPNSKARERNSLWMQERRKENAYRSSLLIISKEGPYPSETLLLGSLPLFIHISSDRALYGGDYPSQEFLGGLGTSPITVRLPPANLPWDLRPLLATPPP